MHYRLHVVSTPVVPEPEPAPEPEEIDLTDMVNELLTGIQTKLRALSAMRNTNSQVKSAILELCDELDAAKLTL
jgi:hypothetical protein